MSSLLRESPEPKRQPPQWRNGFVIDGVVGGPIRLAQLDRKTFALSSKIEYRGDTGLDEADLPADVLEKIRTLDPAVQPGGEFLTDLASVPGPTRWFLGAYGEHTPAVLIHDWLIPVPEGMEGLTEVHADRYLRFMLKRIGMRWLKRWIMWSAVALRTRFAAGGLKRLSVVAWIAGALAGNSIFFVALLTGDLVLLATSVVLPILFAALWGRQYGAGIIAAIAAPWLLPPSVLAAIGYAIYVAIERLRELVVGSPQGGQPERGTIMPEGV